MVIKEIEKEDIEQIASFEQEISEISFGEDAIIDIQFHKKKIIKAMNSERDGMFVLHEGKEIIGWLWMAIKTNYLTEEKYINFKSFYINKDYRGEEYTNILMQKGIDYAKKNNVKYVVGKVNINNFSMRLIYSKFGFEPTHLTMELKMKDDDSNEN